MDFFERFYSNTLAGGGSQSFFMSEQNKILRGRIFYKIFAGGKYEYSLLYSNMLDSTVADGSYSRKNMVCEPWKIHSVTLRVTSSCEDESGEKTELTFEGSKEKNVAPGEIFNSDPAVIEARTGDYLCVETVFSGTVIPSHPESQLPAFIFENGSWSQSTQQPFPSCVGCSRPVKHRIAYFGDSITQGIGVGYDNYNFWAGILSEKTGRENGYWNLGLGFGRCDDASGGGPWLYKAQQTEYVFVCFGVNDLYQGFTGDELIKNLTVLVKELHRAGCKVLVQTVPPGDYDRETEKEWLKTNAYIKENRKLGADAVFDSVPYLVKKGGSPSQTQADNVHPDEKLCRIWAENLYPEALEFLKK